MREQLYNLATNTTSLVGYIAILMFVGAYLGGDKSYAFDPAVFKGSLSEYNTPKISQSNPLQGVVVTIDGRKYEVDLKKIVEDNQVKFTY